MICRIILSLFIVAYLIALGLYLVGTFGWFGRDRDPLSALFLVPLGLPWNLIEIPETYRAGFAATAPIVNIAIIHVLCRLFARRR